MPVATAGIHHVSSIAGDPQRNVDFYAGVLGLRLVKLTVNYDDPGSYHLYYGNERGDPGSILTFFPWGREAAPGRVGIGQVAITSLSIVPHAIAYWVGRLIAKGVKYAGPHRRFDDQLLSFGDPDGNQIELIAHESAATRPAWSDGPIPADSAIRGIHSVTLLEADLDPAAQVLSTVLGFRPTRSEETRFRFEAAGDSGNIVDVRAAGEFWGGTMGPGTVHHVAFRARSAEEQERTRDEVLRSGLGVTPVLDRKYFQSIYFREPGGVLFESATDEPGFLVDEPVESLGGGLQLPAWLMGDRPVIERRLEPLHPPHQAGIQP
jgi:catechol 2,3-dioxygenase-like lactoylglutathione lyase family enzyme